MGSANDWSTMRRVVDTLDELGVESDALVLSAHRMPDEMFAFAERARERGVRAIIAGAGGAAHLPGMLAAKTTVPVLGVPVMSKHLNGLDSLYSIVQMPAGVPVATFAIGESGAVNAALFAVAMLAGDDPELAASLQRYRVGAVPRRRRPVSIAPPRRDTDPAAGRHRHAWRRSARPVCADGGPHDGLPHLRARPRRPCAGGRDRGPSSRGAVRRSGVARRARPRLCRRHHRVREPARRGARAARDEHVRGAVTSSGGRRPGPHRREVLPLLDRRADRAVGAARRRLRRGGRRRHRRRCDRQDRPPRLRRQGSAPCPRRRRGHRGGVGRARSRARASWRRGSRSSAS